MRPPSRTEAPASRNIATDIRIRREYPISISILERKLALVESTPLHEKSARVTIIKRSAGERPHITVAHESHTCDCQKDFLHHRRQINVIRLHPARFFFFFSILLTDYHTHTPLCRHAEGFPVEYAAAAVAAGLAEIGFSDHNPMPEPFDDWRMDLSEFPRYLELVETARGAFPNLPIRLSLECDYLEGREDWLETTRNMAPWDYLIGSVHYIAPGWDVDNPKHLSRWKEAGAVEEIWALYWHLYEKCVRSGFFDFCAHPDLAKKFGFRPPGDLRRYYEPVIQAFADTGTVMEINTAGLRKDVREIYPSQDLLGLAFSAGIPIVINSDAHAASEVGQDFDQALQLVRGVGYTHTVRFHQGQRLSVPLPDTWPMKSPL